ncbi:MAG: hypothetical protein ACXV4B_03610 [Halobacteriota archaeon]
MDIPPFPVVHFSNYQKTYGLFDVSLSQRLRRDTITDEIPSSFVHAIQRHALPAEIQQLLHNILSAYFRTKPLEELVDIKDRSKRPLQLVYIALAGAECTSCASAGEELVKHPLSVHPLEVRAEAVQNLLSSVANILEGTRSPTLSFYNSAELLSECKGLLCQVMCAHDAEKLGISVLGIYEQSKSER